MKFPTIKPRLKAIIKQLMHIKHQAHKKVQQEQKAAVRKFRKNYFETAKSWADDLYTETIASRNRYRIAFYWSCTIATLLLVVIVSLMPLRHTELVVVHQYNDGAVWVEPTHLAHTPKNKAQISSEIVRYVINRESYSPFAYDTQYSLVLALSGNAVAKQYAMSQRANNKEAPINKLGRGYRKTHIENIVFLDLKTRNKKKETKHRNLAQVNFTVTDYNNDNTALPHQKSNF